MASPVTSAVAPKLVESNLQAVPEQGPRINPNQLDRFYEISDEVNAATFTSKKLQRNGMILAAAGIASIVLSILIFAGTLGLGTGFAVGFGLAGAKLIELAVENFKKSKEANSVISSARNYRADALLRDPNAGKKKKETLEDRMEARFAAQNEQMMALIGRLAPAAAPAAAAPAAAAPFVAPVLPSAPDAAFVLPRRA